MIGIRNSRRLKLWYMTVADEALRVEVLVMVLELLVGRFPLLIEQENYRRRNIRVFAAQNWKPLGAYNIDYVKKSDSFWFDSEAIGEDAIGLLGLFQYWTGYGLFCTGNHAQGCIPEHDNFKF